MKHNRPNCVQIDKTIFIVRTQAGFNKAIKLMKESYKDAGKELGLIGQYPTIYPAVAFFTIDDNNSDLRIK